MYTVFAENLRDLFSNCRNLVFCRELFSPLGGVYTPLNDTPERKKAKGVFWVKPL